MTEQLLLSSRELLIERKKAFKYIGVLSADYLAKEVSTGAPWEFRACYGVESTYISLDWCSRYYGAMWGRGSEGGRIDWGVVHFRELLTEAHINSMSDKDIEAVNEFLDTLLQHGLVTPEKAFEPISQYAYAEVRATYKGPVCDAVAAYGYQLEKSAKRVVMAAEAAFKLGQEDALFVRYLHPDRQEGNGTQFWAWRVRDYSCMFRGAIGMDAILPDTITREQYIKDCKARDSASLGMVSICK